MELTLEQAKELESLTTKIAANIKTQLPVGRLHESYPETD